MKIDYFDKYQKSQKRVLFKQRLIEECACQERRIVLLEEMKAELLSQLEMINITHNLID